VEDFIRSVTHDTRVVVHLVGDIDVVRAGPLRQRLTELIDAGRTDLIVDLTEVVFMDSSGLGVLVGALKATRKREGRLELVVPRGTVTGRVLRLSGLDRVFVTHETVEAALAR
jgi:anti-sigma B factor antagonist